MIFFHCFIVQLLYRLQNARQFLKFLALSLGFAAGRYTFSLNSSVSRRLIVRVLGTPFRGNWACRKEAVAVGIVVAILLIILSVLDVVHGLLPDRLFALNEHVWRWRWSARLMTPWHTPKPSEISTWVSPSALSATIFATIWIKTSRFLPILKVKEMSKISQKSIYMAKNHAIQLRCDWSAETITK